MAFAVVRRVGSRFVWARFLAWLLCWLTLLLLNSVAGFVVWFTMDCFSRTVCGIVRSFDFLWVASLVAEYRSYMVGAVGLNFVLFITCARGWG